jgi:hypothetical protein
VTFDSLPNFTKTIPAFPGFYVLGTTGDRGPEEVIRDPVIAWALEDEILAPYPITLEGVKGDVYVLQPDGRVVKVCSEKYANVDAYLKWQQMEYEESQRKAK